jgi:PAS domain S-box-containing protein
LKKPKSPSTAPALLRQKAEERVAGKPSKTGLSLTENETRKLIYELEVHQIELELQNQELMVANSLAQEANLKYIELFDFAPIGYFILSREGEILALNLCGSQMLGKGRAQIQQSRFGFFVSDETKPVFNLFLENIFLNKTKESCELVLSLDGHLSIHVHLSGNINRTDGNSLVTMVEITRLKQTEEALRKSERFLKDTQIITRLGTYSIDLLKGRWEGSEILDTLYGIEPGFDHSLEGLASVVHPEWGQIMQEYFNNVILAHEPKFDKEYKIIRQNDKKERWVHSIGRVEYDVNHQPTHLLGTISDITDRKQSEEALSQSQALLMASIEGQKDTLLFSIDREYRYLYFNQAHKESMKYSYNSDIGPGESILQHITSLSDRETAKLNYDRALKGESHSNIREYGDVKTDWFESSFNPIVNKKNQIIGITGLARIINERKHTEDALLESESRFRNLLQDVQSISVQGYAPDGTTQYWNRASEHLYGYSAQEAIGRNLLELIVPPEILSDVDQAIRFMAGTGHAIPASEMMLMHKDGSRVPVFSSHTIIQVPGKDQELFCIDIDLTELKKTEQALKKSEAKFRQLYESIMDAIVAFDLNGMILSANNVFLKMLDYTMDELATHNFRDLTPTKWIGPEVEKYVKQILQRGYSDTYEKEFRRKDGSLVPVEMRGFIIKDEKGEADYMWAIVRDITERKLNEKILDESRMRLSKSQKMAHLGSWELDLHTGLFIWSDEVYRIFGLSHREFNGTFTEVLASVHPDDREMLKTGFSRSVQNKDKGFTAEHRIIRKHSGEIRIVLEKCMHIRNASGKIVSSLGMVHDITEQKRAQEEIRKSEGQFRLLFEANSDGITVFRFHPDKPPSEIIDMNENAAKMLGYSKSEMQLLSPHDLEIGLTAEKLAKRSHDIQSKGFSSFETIFRHKDNHGIYVEIKVLAVIYNNGPALMNIVRDITERKIFENQLQEYGGRILF